MAEFDDWNDLEDDPHRGAEAMIRAAGQYVRASDDLRPRVLESARMDCGERRAQRRVRHMAVFAALLAFFTTGDEHGFNAQHTSPSGLLMAAGFNELLAPAAAATTRSGDGDWRMIEAFTELRRQQAEVLRCAP